MFCKNCGKFLSADAKFCSECGTKVEVEAPQPKPAPPMFFTQETEVKKERPKKVVHLDEFNWDLDGYPTAPKKTEEVDFNWASVLEEKSRVYAPRTLKPKEEEKPVEVQEDAPAETTEPEVTVEELVEALPEGSTDVETGTEGAAEAVESGEPAELESALFETMEKDSVQEPTRLIDKAQIKAEGVDHFYAFNEKQAELQAMLDEEYARIQNGDYDEDAPLDEEAVELPEILQVEEDAGEPVEQTEEAGPVAEETEIEEDVAVEDVEPAPVELVGVVWASTPAGVVVESEEETVVMEDEEPVEAVDVEEAVEEAASVEAEVAEEVETVQEPAEEACPSKAEEEQPEEPPAKLTFDDVFRDDEDDDEEKEKGGCLKVIAILLIILVIIELGILGIQKFAKDSQAAAYINQAYAYVVDLIVGGEEDPEQEEVSGPSEVQQMITKQMVKNENIVSVVENTQLLFEEGETYGYDEFTDTYAFQNSPWYENEEGESISFGDEIIGTLIQYYSALADRMNDVNKDVFDFVDDTSAFYEEIEAIEGKEDLQYVINNLEIGEIRTGVSGFYVLVRVNAADGQNVEGTTEKQVVYLEPNTSKNEMNIVEIQKI